MRSFKFLIPALALVGSFVGIGFVAAAPAALAEAGGPHVVIVTVVTTVGVPAATEALTLSKSSSTSSLSSILTTSASATTTIPSNPNGWVWEWLPGGKTTSLDTTVSKTAASSTHTEVTKTTATTQGAKTTSTDSKKTSAIAEHPAPSVSADIYDPEWSGWANGCQDCDNTYIRRVMEHHNYHRRNHSVPEITWDNTLAQEAWILAQKCEFRHNTTSSFDGKQRGQNMLAATPSDHISEVVTNAWYNGEYEAVINFLGGEPSDDPEQLDLWSHMTQVLWKEAKHVGCATFWCGDSGKSGLGVEYAPNVEPWLTFCNYDPPGNWPGQFHKNLSPGSGAPVIDWTWSL
ncbi:hypothetical protein LTS18_003719 [Coniosporium uncinatum]|uniref:Uncharacterized protein n=1 Tax=Coniosporium uncinatum TaxID=93489 RepID=A0ACC3DTI6_9PEZI|nr:hypothetical protein LTS18_003719 [Coniosporium uncinatum]